MKLYPIINLNIDANQYSYEDIQELYKFLIASIKSWEAYETHIEAIEISLASNLALDLLPELMHETKLAVGSVISFDQALFLKEGLKPVELFSPVYDKEIAEILLASGHQYIPGIYSSDELPENLSSKLKIYPMNANNPKQLLKFMQGPYPELRRASLASRIICLEEEMADRYQAYEKIQEKENIKLITKPSDYQKIRKQFIVDNRIKLVFRPEQRDLSQLIESIKEKSIDTKIVLAGLASFSEAQSIPDIDYIATRMFKAVILDILSGAISKEEAKNLIHEELSQYCSISA